jgi:hypothetical protein
MADERIDATLAGITSALACTILVSVLLQMVAPGLKAAPHVQPHLLSALQAGAAVTLDQFLYLPLTMANANAHTCQRIPGETYQTISVNPPPTDRPAEQHADLNLGLRGYTLTSASLSLVNINGTGDGNAPQFPGLFGDNRTPQFTSVDRVYNWNWTCDCATTPISDPPVTLLGMGTTAGETIGVPNSGYAIGSGYEVLVLYTAPGRITLKYTRDDNVINGYTIHVEGVYVEPDLLALYESANVMGRGQLPALRSGQAFGRAAGSSILVGIQDAGTWMEPRSRNDWWQGR